MKWHLPTFGISRGVKQAAQARGLRLRSRVTEVGGDNVQLTASERSSLNLISQAAENLDWIRAKATSDRCNQHKTPLCNAAMHAAFRCGNYQAGARIYTQMCDRGTLVTGVTYNCAIRLFSKLGQQGKILELWEEARSNWTSWVPGQRYLLLSEMVNAFADSGNVTGIGVFLDTICKEGFEIDEGTWGAALNGCKNAGAASVAEYFLKLMRQFNVSANLIHHTLVMGAYAGRSLENITRVAENSEPLGIDEYFVEMHVTSLAGPYKNTSKTRNVADALEIVQKANSSHNAAALNVIADAQSRASL